MMKKFISTVLVITMLITMTMSMAFMLNANAKGNSITINPVCTNTINGSAKNINKSFSTQNPTYVGGATTNAGLPDPRIGLMRFDESQNNDIQNGYVGSAKLNIYIYQIAYLKPLIIKGLTDTDKTVFDDDSSYNSITSETIKDVVGEGAKYRYETLAKNAGEWLEIDVTDYVQAQTDGIYSFELTCPTAAASGKMLGYNTLGDNKPYISMQIVDEDTYKAQADLDAFDKETATENFSLPAEGSEYQSTMTWKSESPYISISGNNATVITPLSEEYVIAKIIGTATQNSKTLEKEYSIKVMRTAATDTDKTYAHNGYGTFVTYHDGYTNKNYNDKYFGYAVKYVNNTFVSFNYPGEDMSNITYAELKMYCYGTFNNGVVMNAYGLPTEMKNIDETTITGAQAIEDGLYEYSGNHTSRRAKPGEIICQNGIDVTDYVKAQTDGVYAFKLDTDTQDLNNIGYYIDYVKRPAYTGYIKTYTGDRGNVLRAVANIDVADKVADNFALPSTVNGCNVSWTSDNPAIVISGDNATVTRSETDTPVKICAVVTKNEISEVAEFDVTVARTFPKGVINLSRGNILRDKLRVGELQISADLDNTLVNESTALIVCTYDDTNDTLQEALICKEWESVGDFSSIYTTKNINNDTTCVRAFIIDLRTLSPITEKAEIRP